MEMGSTFRGSRFSAALLRWYDANKRDLPWRRDREPYRVWVSEIMLQQTRVAAVLSYYERFLERFPDVHSLARARESTVLAMWSGLGYYRRARYLHAAARVVSRQMSARFPVTSSEWRQLPGVGEYTAAAIASIAFGEPCAVVDGNVERVLRRVAGNPNLAGRELWAAAQAILSRRRPGDFNQAMMELGATVCVPEQPRCGQCPVLAMCGTKGSLQGATTPTRNRRELAYVLGTKNGAVYLVQRGDGPLMPGMWELPSASRELQEHQPVLRVRHSIPDTDYSVVVVAGAPGGVESGRWVPVRRIAGLPLTGLCRKILRKAEII
jgi:A/G-specific adenine glycosylase